MIDRRGRTYVRDNANGLITTRAGILPIHAETSPGSGIFTAAIDLTPERITTGGNDGWRINSNGWHFALGQPAGRVGDGWIGFGGRGGQHWMFSRLQGVGYLHGPTRTWRDLGGPPTYNRANLSSGQVRPFQFGGETFSRKALATWSDLWPALPAGQIDLELAIRGHGLKEFIRVNQAARAWISANRPPLTPLNETWFGFQWELDLADIPEIWQGRLIGRGDDFEDTNGNIELRDGISRTLGFIVPGNCWIDGARRVITPNELQRRRPAIQRFWNGDRFFIGIRADHLASMAAGDLIIDPPQTTDTATGADDGYEGSDNVWYSNQADNYLAGSVDNNVGMRFALSAMTAETVTASAITFDWGSDQGNTGTFNWTLIARDVADAPAYGNTSLPSSDVAAGTTATVGDSQSGNPTASSSDTSPSLNTIFQELVDSYGDTINNVRISWDAVTADGDYLSVGDAEAGGTIVDPSISVSQSAGGGGGTSIVRQMLMLH